MRWRTCRLFLLISVLALTARAASLTGGAAPDDKQASGKKPASVKALMDEMAGEPKAPLFGGIYLSADVFGFVLPTFVKDAFYNNEVALSVDLRHRFYPTAEVGYGHCHTVGDLYGIRYATAAPYFRVGMDYNMQYKTGRPSYIYLGARVGYSRSAYEVEAPALTDAVTGAPYDFHLTDMPCRALWMEALVGIRAQIWSDFYMGWCVRYKRPLRSNTSANGNPWFMPGFGVHGSETVGATYNLTWYFHAH